MMNENIETQNITKTLEINYMPYAMSVIVSRAIPEIDGFKPAHRKLLYTMYKMGLLNGQRIKSADVVGQTMRLNPHGDQAIYETLVRLTRGNAALLHPFIDSKGNFGKHTSRDMAYAASRYTEVKLDTICNELFKDIEKDTVDFCDNYNGTMKEPFLFPTTFPNLLVTANQGIAVGMASSICSFNLKEICLTTIDIIKKVQNPLKNILAPDFSTGAELIYNEAELNQIYETGRGSFKLRSKYHFDKKNNSIIITEIPYTTTVEMIIDKIISMVKDGKIKEINDVRDETDLSGLKIAIDIKRTADPDLLMKKLFIKTPLMDNFSCNFNILINGVPKVMGVLEILENWIINRRDGVRRRSLFDRNKKQEKYHLLLGLSKIILDIDKAIEIVRNTEEDSLVIKNLMNYFEIDELQAEFIAEIKLRNLNKQFILNKTTELEDLKNEIDELNKIINSDLEIDNLICKELKEIIKKYGKDRNTIIVETKDHEAVEEETFIEDYAIKLFLTDHNYFKKITLQSLRSSGEQYLKDDDFVITEIETTNKSDIIFFSDKFNAYKLKAYEINECKASSIGDYLNNLLKMPDDEKIVSIVTTTDYSGFLIFAYANGKIAKINLDSFKTKVNRKKLINSYYDKSKLTSIHHILEDEDFVAIRDNDKGTLFNSSLISPKSTKNSCGIQVLTLKKGSIMSKCIKKELFSASDPEHYRTTKIPSAGHFFIKKDMTIQTILDIK